MRRSSEPLPCKQVTDIFPNSTVDNMYGLPGETPSGPSGSVNVVELTVFGQQLVVFNAGPFFKLNPAISFIVNFDPLLFGNSASRDKEARSKLNEAWEKLADGGVIRSRATNIRSASVTDGSRINTECHGD
jgi:predicted 3-demethylubiquinone-9 3-methyltransferase (glyoxalase superfamily)